MSATVTNWPAVTAMPLLVSVLFARVGLDVICGGDWGLAVCLLGSVKPNSSAVKVWAVSSLVVIVLSVPAGASFTLVTLRSEERRVGKEWTSRLSTQP